MHLLFSRRRENNILVPSLGGPIFERLETTIEHVTTRGTEHEKLQGKKETKPLPT